MRSVVLWTAMVAWGGPAERLLPGAAWWTRSGQAFGDLGRSVALGGDVDGDGYGDALVGAPGLGLLSEGGAQLYVGSRRGLGAAPAWSVPGLQSGADTGYALAFAGDVDGDGYADVLVGSPWWDGPQRDEGKVQVFHGSAAGLGAAPALELESDAEFSGFGASLGAAGDVNGDGYDDVVLGLSGYRRGQAAEGAVAVHFGSAAGLGAAPAWFHESNLAYTALGGRVAGGDFDGDGFSDVVASAWDEVGPGAFVFLGAAAGLSQSPDWTATAPAEGGFAEGLAVGDVNGDGFADLVLGAPHEEHGGDTERGAVYAYLGSPAGLSVAPDWRVEADTDGGWFGSTVAVGDLDGDGYGDVVVGAPIEDRALVYVGSASGPSARPALVITSDQARSDFGWSLSAGGDVDGDGSGDLLVGAPQYTEIEIDEGAAFLYLGRRIADADGDAVYDLVDLCPRAPDPDQLDADGDLVGNACDAPAARVTTSTTLSPGEPVALVADGAAPGEVVWFAAALGAGGAGPCPGALGGLCLALGPGALELGSAVADAAGVATLDRALPAIQPGGSAVVQAAIRRGPGGAASVASHPVLLDGSRLDFDADGLSDELEGRLGTDPSLADSDADGRSDADELGPWLDPRVADADGDGVLDGVDACLAGDDADDADADLVADACDACPLDPDPGQADADADGLGDPCDLPVFGAPAWVGRGAAGENYGAAVASAGDVDGDGYDDLLVGAPGTSAPELHEGAALVYEGSALGPSLAPTWRVESDEEAAELGGAVASAGDVNGDGYADVLVGAAGSFGATGWVDLYLGSPAGLPASPSWIGRPDFAGAGFGRAVASAGDVNGDGYDDVLVGAPDEAHGEAAEGRVYFFPGSPTGPFSRPAWIAEVDQAYAHFGSAVAGAGDVNGDGYDDVIVGAGGWDEGADNAGGAWLYLGGPNGPAPSPAWRVTGAGAQDELGVAVASAGDVNGDGYADLAIGSGTWPEGTAAVYLGSPRGPEATPWWTARGAPDGSEFGAFLAPAGDVDRDGYDDLLVSAWDESHGQDGEGRAYLWLGSAEGLAPAPAWTAESDVTWAFFGYGLSSAGDVNGDGAPDVVVGAWGARPGGAAVLYLAP